MKVLNCTIAAAVLATGCGTGTAVTTAGATLPAATFTSSSAHVTNPWFPLKPGTTLTYAGSDEGKKIRDVFRVTRATRVVNGVRCVVIDDRVYREGVLAERTTDWYAQDRAGNVWYLGEETATLDSSGKVKSTDGTWLDGRDGARRGLFMPARPRVGRSYQQEYYKGHAEDRFRIKSLSTRVRTPAASSAAAMLTEETSALEPGVLDHKVYVRGIGTVTEETVKGGSEMLKLVSVTHR